MANTTWNPADKTGTVTLTGGNLIATATASAAWVRTVDTKLSGKFYWEVTMTTWANASTGIGLTNPTSTPNIWNATGLAALCNNGQLYLSGTAIINLFSGTLTSGTVIGFALDAGTKLLWVRVGASGNWNGNATYSPGGTGGASLSAISGALCPVAEFAAASDAANANFGDSAFTGAVPAGFTSGFGPATAAAAQARVMVLA